MPHPGPHFLPIIALYPRGVIVIILEIPLAFQVASLIEFGCDNLFLEVHGEGMLLHEGLVVVWSGRDQGEKVLG